MSLRSFLRNTAHHTRGHSSIASFSSSCPPSPGEREGGAGRGEGVRAYLAFSALPALRFSRRFFFSLGGGLGGAGGSGGPQGLAWRRAAARAVVVKARAASPGAVTAQPSSRERREAVPGSA